MSFWCVHSREAGCVVRHRNTPSLKTPTTGDIALVISDGTTRQLPDDIRLLNTNAIILQVDSTHVAVAYDIPDSEEDAMRRLQEEMDEIETHIPAEYHERFRKGVTFEERVVWLDHSIITACQENRERGASYTPFMTPKFVTRVNYLMQARDMGPSAYEVRFGIAMLNLDRGEWYVMPVCEHTRGMRIRDIARNASTMAIALTMQTIHEEVPQVISKIGIQTLITRYDPFTDAWTLLADVNYPLFTKYRSCVLRSGMVAAVATTVLEHEDTMEFFCTLVLINETVRRTVRVARGGDRKDFGDTGEAGDVLFMSNAVSAEYYPSIEVGGPSIISNFGEATPVMGEMMGYIIQEMAESMWVPRPCFSSFVGGSADVPWRELATQGIIMDDGGKLTVVSEPRKYSTIHPNYVNNFPAILGVTRGEEVWVLISDDIQEIFQEKECHCEYLSWDDTIEMYSAVFRFSTDLDAFIVVAFVSREGALLEKHVVRSITLPSVDTIHMAGRTVVAMMTTGGETFKYTFTIPEVVE